MFSAFGTPSLLRLATTLVVTTRDVTTRDGKASCGLDFNSHVVGAAENSGKRMGKACSQAAARERPH